VYVKAYDNLRNKSESELKSILKARNKSARSGAQSSPISVAESYIARQILDGKTKELDAEYAKPEESNQQTSEVESAYDILESTGLDFLPGSLEILVKRLGERGISEQDVANALLDARTNTVYDLGEILHANKINQPKQGEVLDLSDATLGEKKKVKAFDEALSNLKITQDSDFVKAPIEGISDAAIAEMSNENYRELVETGYTQWYGKTGEAEEAATYVKNTYKVGDTQISANENNDVSSPPKGSPVSQSFLQFPSDEEIDDVDNFDDVDFEDVNMGFDPSEDLSKQDDGKPETKCKK
jgi:hypothetical protein